MTARSEGERGNDRWARPLRDPRLGAARATGGVPGGTVKPGETPAHADVRETLEEAGLVVIAGEEISHYTNPDTNGRPLTFHTLTYLGT